MTVPVQRPNMPEFINPYQPGEPIADRDLFFGRQDILGSVREHLVRGRRVIIVAGARRMGKTSLLWQLAGELPEGFVFDQLALREESTRRLDWLLWRIADSVTAQVRRQFGLAIAEPAWPDFDGQPRNFLEEWWPAVVAALGDRVIVLGLDDVDSLDQSEPGLVAQLSSLLTEWRSSDARWGLVVTTNRSYQERLLRDHPALFGGAAAFLLGPMSGEDATRLVTRPVEGTLVYDYGVARRLIELASGHPYFLQLLCHKVFNRCAPAGWVNQRDVDLVREELVRHGASEFQQIWDESTPEERAILASLVSMRGARGVATIQEVHTVLNRVGGRVRREEVEAVLDRLEAREVLERLGALSYRFRVALLQDWLRERVDVREVVREADWARVRSDLTKRARPARRKEKRSRSTTPAPGGLAEEEEGLTDGRRKPGTRRFRWLWPALTALILVSAAVAVGRVLLRPGQPGDAATATATRTSVVALVSPAAAAKADEPGTSSATLEAEATRAVRLSPTAQPVEATKALPTATASPSPPVVVSRPVPSIAYLSRRATGGDWLVWLMNSDGTSRTSLFEAGADFLSPPTWSPDGTSIAFISDQSGSADVWVAGVDGSKPVNLTNDDAKDHSPAWSPTGEWIAFASVRDALYWEIYAMRPDGTDIRRVTWWDDASDLSPSWSPDGQRLAFASKRDGNWEIYSVDLDGSNLIRLTEHPADDTHPAWAPDGSRIAFESDRAGFADIFVMPAIGGSAINLTNLDWATDLGPTWSPDGGRLAFYSDRDGEWDVYVMASDGSEAALLTGGESVDQLPSWRP